MKAIRLTFLITSFILVLFIPQLVNPSIWDNIGPNKAGLRIYVKQFNKSTGAAPVDQSVTGVGFKPKAIIFYGQAHNFSGSSDKASASIGFATDGIKGMCASTIIDDGTTTHNSYSILDTNNVFRFLSNKGTGDTAVAELKSMDDDGFTLTWTTNQSSTWDMKAICIGGDGIDTAYVDYLTAKASGGVQTYGDPGFTPDVIFFASSAEVTSPTTTDSGGISFGFASLLSQSAMTNFTEGGGIGTSDAWHYYDTSAAYVQGYLSSGHQIRSADLDSFDSLGYSLDWTNNATAAALISLSIKGGIWEANHLQATTGTNTRTHGGGGYGASEGMVFFSAGAASIATEGDDFQYNLGGKTRPDATSGGLDATVNTLSAGEEDGVATQNTAGNDDQNSMDIYAYSGATFGVKYNVQSLTRGFKSYDENNTNGTTSLWYTHILANSKNDFVFRQDFSVNEWDLEEARLDQTSSDINFGDESSDSLGNLSSNAKRMLWRAVGYDSLLRAWDKTFADVDSMKFWVFSNNEAAAAAETLGIYIVDSPWAEGTGTGAGGDTANVTWNDRDHVINTDDTAWTTAGGDYGPRIATSTIDEDTWSEVTFVPPAVWSLGNPWNTGILGKLNDEVTASNWKQVISGGWSTDFERMAAFQIFFADTVQSTWGGTAYQDADSMDATYILETSTNNNYGSQNILTVRDPADGDDGIVLLRITNDPRTLGYVQDSAKVHLFWASGEPDVDTDTMTVYMRILKTKWGEGDNDDVAADTTEASWDSSWTKVNAWNTGGARGDASDRNSKIIDSVTLAGIQVSGDEYTFTIPGEFLTDEFFRYGVAFYAGTKGGDDFWSNMRFHSDDQATAAYRPYIEGWESPPDNKFSADWVTRQEADDLSTAHIDASSQDNNTGGWWGNKVRHTTGVTYMLIKPTVDNRIPGYKDDSAKFFIKWQEGDQPDVTPDTVVVRVYALKRVWREGDKSNTASEAGEVDYVSAIEGHDDWGTAGALNTSTDYNSTKIDSFFVGWDSDPWFEVTIPGPWVDDVFKYGMKWVADNHDGTTTGDVWFYTEDHSTRANRPYFIGWQSEPTPIDGTTQSDEMYYGASDLTYTIRADGDGSMVSLDRLEGYSHDNWGDTTRIPVRSNLKNSTASQFIVKSDSIPALQSGYRLDSILVGMNMYVESTHPLNSESTFVGMYIVRKDWKEGQGRNAESERGWVDARDAQHDVLAWTDFGAWDETDRDTTDGGVAPYGFWVDSAHRTTDYTWTTLPSDVYALWADTGTNYGLIGHIDSAKNGFNIATDFIGFRTDVDTDSTGPMFLFFQTDTTRWGGVNYQFADSVRATYVDENNPTTNFGTDSVMSVQTYTGGGFDTALTYIKPEMDLRNHRKDQDSIKLVLTRWGNGPRTGDSAEMRVYILTAGFTEGSVTWNSGRPSFNATPIITQTLRGETSPKGITRDTITIPSTNYDDFFAFGIMIIADEGLPSEDIGTTWYTDDNPNAGARPFIIGYESDPTVVLPYFGWPVLGPNIQEEIGNDALVSTGNTTAGINYTAKGGEVIDSIYVAAKSNDGDPETLFVALYEYNGEPDHINWGGRDTAIIEFSQTIGWYGVDVNWPLQKGFSYCLGVGDSEAGDLTSEFVDIRYTAGGTEDAEMSAGGNLNDPWGAEKTNQSRLYSMYATLDTAAQQGIIGDSTYANANISSPISEYTYWQTLTGKTYLAGDDEIVTGWSVWVQNMDTIAFGLYEWDVANDSPTVLVYSDTMIEVQRNSENIWRHRPVWWPLTSGKTYSAAAANVDDNGVPLFKGDGTHSGVDSAGRFEDSTGIALINPYNSGGAVSRAASINFFAEVNYLPNDTFYLGFKPDDYESNRTTSSNWGTGTGLSHRNPKAWHVADSDQVITEIHFWGAGLCLPNMELTVGVYEVVGDTCKWLLYQDTMILGDNSPADYGPHSITGLNIPMTAGHTYGLASTNDDGCGIGITWYVFTDDQYGAFYTTSTQTNPWTVDGSNSESMFMWAVGTAGTQRHWGSAVNYQFSDSMDVVQIIEPSLDDNNYGAFVSTSLRTGGGGHDEGRNSLYKMVNDPRTAGYVQDSVKLHVLLQANMDPDVVTDTTYILGHVLRVPFGEGDNSGTAADAGEVSWNASEEGTNDWTTAGAQSTADDRFSAIACSLLVPGEVSRPATWLTFTFVSPPDEFFDNGVLLTMASYSKSAYETMDFFSDDYSSNTSFRPWFEGWESPPSGGLAGNIFTPTIHNGTILKSKLLGYRGPPYDPSSSEAYNTVETVEVAR